MHTTFAVKFDFEPPGTDFRYFGLWCPLSSSLLACESPLGLAHLYATVWLIMASVSFLQLAGLMPDCITNYHRSHTWKWPLNCGLQPASHVFLALVKFSEICH